MSPANTKAHLLEYQWLQSAWAKRLKPLLRRYCPTAYEGLVFLFKRLPLLCLPRRVIFQKTYQNKWWSKNTDSRSGPGSSLEQTKVIRDRLPLIFQRWDIRSILDIPCGDFNWMKEVRPFPETYMGGDIVESLIEHNRSKYGTAKRRFVLLDLIKDPLPKVDLIFCRDLFVHLPFRLIHRCVENIKRSGATYLLTTTYPQRDSNPDILTGEWRPVNLRARPFRFPEPLELLTERSTEKDGEFADKSLALWKITDLT